MAENEVVCIQCGQPIGDPPRLNLLAEEEPCPACAERLLESLPGIFHTPYESPTEAPVDTGSGYEGSGYEPSDPGVDPA